jgi:hypothetical protein
MFGVFNHSAIQASAAGFCVSLRSGRGRAICFMRRSFSQPHASLPYKAKKFFLLLFFFAGGF